MEKVTVTKQLLDNFKRNPLTLILYGYLTAMPNTCLYQSGSSYATITHNGKFFECTIATDDLAFVDEFVGTFSDCYAEFRMITPKIANHLAQKYQFGYRTTCGLYVWNGKPLPHVCQGDLRKMSSEFADMVAKGTDYATKEDVIELLNLHPSSALYVDGKPVCWCLLHLEKSLGMLYTLPEHRKKGYALDVMTHLTNQVIRSGDIPYATIVKGNVPSQNLALKYQLQYVCDVDYVAIDFANQRK